MVIVSASVAAVALSTPTNAPVATLNAAAVQRPIDLRRPSKPDADDITVRWAEEILTRAAERRDGRTWPEKAIAELARQERITAVLMVEAAATYYTTDS